MSSLLKITLLAADGEERIAVLNDKSTLIGRAPEPTGIRLQTHTKAMSAIHGQFLRHDGYWFYRDLESTNGSWLDEQRLPANELIPIIDQQNLILADVALRTEVSYYHSDQDDQTLASDKLFVFYKKNHLKTITLDSDTKLSIGDSGKDLVLSENETIAARVQFLNNTCEVLVDSPEDVLSAGLILPKEQVIVFDDLQNVHTGKLDLVYAQGVAEISRERLPLDTDINPVYEIIRKTEVKSGFGSFRDEDQPMMDREQIEEHKQNMYATEEKAGSLLSNMSNEMLIYIGLGVLLLVFLILLILLLI